jgi:hypothetical protein
MLERGRSSSFATDLMASSSDKIEMTASVVSKNLRRDIIIILSIKMSIVLVAAIFVFGPDQRPRIDGAALDRHILDRISAGKTESHYQ